MEPKEVGLAKLINANSLGSPPASRTLYCSFSQVLNDAKASNDTKMLSNLAAATRVHFLLAVRYGSMLLDVLWRCCSVAVLTFPNKKADTRK